MELTESNRSILCLSCLRKLGRRKHDVFTEKELLTKYFNCTSICINQNDGYPRYICKSCFTKLELFNEFRAMCLSSFQKLKEIIFKELSVEKEDPLEHLSLQKEENDEGMDSTHLSMNLEIKCEDDNFIKCENEDLQADVDESEVESVSCSVEVKDEEDQVESKSKKSGETYSCTSCNKMFYKLDRYEAHLREHKGLKPFVCQICGREYSKSSGLSSHIKRIHKSQSNTCSYFCGFEKCDKVYKTKDSLRHHCKKVHTPHYVENKHLFICELCGKSFSSNATLKRHGFSHTGEFPFKCDQCGKRCVSQHKLKEHCLRHKGIKNFACPYCGLKKTTKHELNVHINYHTKEKMRKCELCSAAFSNIGNLNRHVNVVHRGIKAFPCKYCDRSFGKAETLKHHEMIHTGEKPHECTECGRKFIQLVALKTHLKWHRKKGREE